jgi:hypothetical protein
MRKSINAVKAERRTWICSLLTGQTGMTPIIVMRLGKAVKGRGPGFLVIPFSREG